MMTKRTRTFVVASAAVLAVGLGTGLVASYIGVRGLPRFTTAGPEELRYVPPDAAVVAYANVRDVMQSDLRRRMRQLDHANRHGREDFQARTGINLETDVDRVVACLTRRTPEGHDAGLVLARGRFDEVRIEGLMRDHGAEVEPYKGKRLVILKGEKQPMALAFLEPGLVAVGNDAAVRQAIELQGGGQSVTGNRELMDLVRDIDTGNAWAVGRFDALAGRAKLPDAVAMQLPPITWFAASGHVNGGLTGTLRAEARDEQAAKNLRDVVRGFMALAKLQTGGNPGLSTVLDSLQMTGDGKTVALAFSVPAEMFDALEQMERAGKGKTEVNPPAPPASPRPPGPPFEE